MASRASSDRRPRKVKYRIEPMSIADFNAAARLWQLTEGVGLDKSDRRPEVERYLARNPGLSYVARSGSELVGALLCGHDGRRGYLYHLAVASEHRRKGLGQKLVSASVAELRRIGIHKCNLFLFSDNANGELFWKKNGWVRRDGLRLMQKALVPSKLRRSC